MCKCENPNNTIQEIEKLISNDLENLSTELSLLSDKTLLEEDEEKQNKLFLLEEELRMEIDEVKRLLQDIKNIKIRYEKIYISKECNKGCSGDRCE